MRLLLLVALCLAGALLVRAASAHASLERSTPSDGQQLATAPARVDLYFAQQLVQNRTGTFAAVFDGAGSVVSDEARLDPTDGKHLVVPLHAGLGADSYEVFWKTTSDEDGGVTLGNFSFSVGALPRGAAARLPGGQVLVP
ncbi:MAG TPA: copper resistance protein CopC, partial [Dehalococcoidia bacterium]|nr:copper resistance protein CopC [Dehalococcoidia bacterium]